MQQRGDREVRFSEQMEELAPMLDQPAERAGLYISAEQLQLLEKLDHLTRYGQFVQVVFGPRGSGKTTLLEQLQSFADTGLSVCRIDAQPDMSLQALQQHLLACMQQDPAVAAQFDAEAGDSTPDASAARLDAYAQAIQGASRQLRLLIDDAHLLQDAALDWLLNQWIPANPDDRQLVLFATPLLVERLNASRLFTEAIATRCHFTRIPAFDRDAIKGYVQHNFPDYAPLFGDAHWQYIEDHSFGLPGRISDVVKRLEQLESSGRWPLQAEEHGAGKRSFKRYGFIAALGLVSLMAVAAFNFLALAPELDTERVSIRLPAPQTLAPEPIRPSAEAGAPERPKTDAELSSPWQTVINGDEPVVAREQVVSGESAADRAVVSSVVEQAGDAAEAVEQPSETIVSTTEEAAEITETSATESADEAPPAVDQAVVDNTAEPAIDSPADDSETAQGGTTTDAETAEKASKKLVLKLPEPSSTANAGSRPAAAPSSVSAATAAAPRNSLTSISSPYLREQELLNWASSGYTLQLLGARKERSVVEFIRNRPDKDKLYYFATLYKDKPWYVVVYGNYPDRDTALAAIAHLPVDLKKRKPWARSVQGVQDDIRRQ